MDYTMDMRTLAVIACAVAATGLVGQAAGMGLDMNIMESVQGHATWLSLSNGPVQRFSVRWENTGSVNCLTRPRIDFYAVMGNSTLGGRVYTSWGSREPLMAGQSHSWKMYSMLPQGSYAAVLRVHHCNELFEDEPYMFAVQESRPAGNLYIDRIDVRGDYVDVAVRSTGEAGDVAVIPGEYPRGWVFQPGVVKGMGPGETAVARLGFVPVWSEGTAISIRAMAMDGSAYGEREFSVSRPEEEPARDWGKLILLSVSIAIIFMVILYVSRFIINIWRRQ